MRDVQGEKRGNDVSESGADEIREQEGLEGYVT